MVGCYQTAEDLSQEAYLKVSVALKQYPIEYPQPFLYQTAKNLALDHLRKEKVRSKTFLDSVAETDCNEISAPAATPETMLMAKQELELLLQSLANQPQRRREILILHKVHGWHYEDIARYFNISKSAVEKNIYAALAQCLSECGA